VGRGPPSDPQNSRTRGATAKGSWGGQLDFWPLLIEVRRASQASPRAPGPIRTGGREASSFNSTMKSARRYRRAGINAMLMHQTCLIQVLLLQHLIAEFSKRPGRGISQSGSASMAYSACYDIHIKLRTHVTKKRPKKRPS
jgi:hypothetical protein